VGNIEVIVGFVLGVGLILLSFTLRDTHAKKQKKPRPPPNKTADAARSVIDGVAKRKLERIEKSMWDEDPADELAALGNARKRDPDQ